jgi:hypothetical protein
MEDLTKLVGASVVVIVLVALAAVLFALPVMFLWNYCLVPAVDAVHPVSFWQAMGISVLFSLLFKNHGVVSKNQK